MRSGFYLGCFVLFNGICSVMSQRLPHLKGKCATLKRLGSIKANSLMRSKNIT